LASQIGSDKLLESLRGTELVRFLGQIRALNSTNKLDETCLYLKAIDKIADGWFGSQAESIARNFWVAAFGRLPVRRYSPRLTSALGQLRTVMIVRLES
jgi:hypothetical protein